jgi:hypothetical protein
MDSLCFSLLNYSLNCFGWEGMAAGLDIYGLVLLEWMSGQFGYGGMHFCHQETVIKLIDEKLTEMWIKGRESLPPTVPVQ